MNLNAISGNGTRVKDFIDVYFLLKEYDFSEIIGFDTKKYQVRNNFHTSKSLTYFDDIQTEEWPQMILENDLTIETMKKTILDKRDDFLTTW